MTGPETAASAVVRPRLVSTLYVAFVLALGAAVVLGVLCVRHRQAETSIEAVDLAPSQTQQEAYAEVMKVADATVNGLINIDYRSPEDSYDAVAETATGSFLDDYKKSYDTLKKLVTQYKAEQTGQVNATAVSTIDANSAAVLVSADATVQNVQTGKQQQSRSYRVKVTVTQQDDGSWRTTDLEFVG
ncbi:hypothetical protein [Nocardioides acrostichi]|uniref:Mce-associated membrane protein n=1 Tax=Nocardioides acrostichi TaxID=2784339 RepID=A0A930YD59_9ACTN|nr:hypothetical protein [Nocardioides acrostichi]MBF4162144.1 hypothetical protein [Nocardioides acrostichi]